MLRASLGRRHLWAGALCLTVASVQALDWFALGQRYEYGLGGAKDLTRAVQAYCHAAELGSNRARFRLAWLYAWGERLPHDDALAAAWARPAAMAGDGPSRRLLGRLGEQPRVRRRCLLPDGREWVDFALLPTRERIESWVRALAPRYGLDPDLVLSLIEVESRFDPRARSAKDARGLMQLLPATAKRFGVLDIWGPLENLKGGMAYLRWLKDRFAGDLRLMLAAYNAGEGAVERHRGIPPYAETRAYVRRILELYQRAKADPGGGR